MWHRTVAGGVDDEVPVADRAWYRTVFEVDDPVEKLRQVARNSTMVRGRVAALARVIGTAAVVDDEIARLQARMSDEFYANQRAIVEHLHGRGHLREGLDVDEAADLLWTINSMRVFFLLVHDRGWPPERYETWLASALCRELLGQSPSS